MLYGKIRYIYIKHIKCFGNIATIYCLFRYINSVQFIICMGIYKVSEAIDNITLISRTRTFAFDEYFAPLSIGEARGCDVRTGGGALFVPYLAGYVIRGE